MLFVKYVRTISATNNFHRKSLSNGLQGRFVYIKGSQFQIINPGPHILTESFLKPPREMQGLLKYASAAFLCVWLI